MSYNFSNIQIFEPNNSFDSLENSQYNIHNISIIISDFDLSGYCTCHILEGKSIEIFR